MTEPCFLRKRRRSAVTAGSVSTYASRVPFDQKMPELTPVPCPQFTDILKRVILCPKEPTASVTEVRTLDLTDASVDTLPTAYTKIYTLIKNDTTHRLFKLDGVAHFTSAIQALMMLYFDHGTTDTLPQVFVTGMKYGPWDSSPERGIPRRPPRLWNTCQLYLALARSLPNGVSINHVAHYTEEVVTHSYLGI